MLKAQDLLRIAGWLRAHDLFRTGAVDDWANGLAELAEQMEPGVVPRPEDDSDGLDWTQSISPDGSIISSNALITMGELNGVEFQVMGHAELTIDPQTGDAVEPNRWSIFMLDQTNPFRPEIMASGELMSPTADLVYCQEMVSITWAYMYIQQTLAADPDV